MLSFCFSSYGRFLYRSQNYCPFSFISSLERLSRVLQAFSCSLYFQTFLDILDIIIRIFRYFNICGKKINKKFRFVRRHKNAAS